MKNMINVPFGKLAAENDAAAKIREQLAKNLKDGKPIELASSGDVTGKTDEQTKLVTQPGKLAEGKLVKSTKSTRTVEEIRAELVENLKRGEPIKLDPLGNVIGQTNEQPICIVEGHLAAEDTAAAKIREQLAKNLKDGKPIELASSGDVTGKTDEQTKLVTQPGKLADIQWYEREPERFRAEKEGMNRFFPQFKLNKMNDGRYYWHGTLRPGVLPNGWAWEVAAIYNNDHPKPYMGGSVRVVLLNPSIDTVINALGWRPYHLLYSEQDGTYLCTTRAEDISYQAREETTAVQSLTWANRWLTALELVMTGDLSKELFNKHDGI